MFFVALVFVLTAAAIVEGRVYGTTVHESTLDCTGKANGVAEIGCDGYVECLNNAAIKHICRDDEYYDRDTHACLKIAGNHPGCANFNVCQGRQDGSYADPQSNCQTYYTCANGLFHGHQYCPPGLFFSEVLQLCDWPWDVLFPCGTKQP